MHFFCILLLLIRVISGSPIASNFSNIENHALKRADNEEHGWVDGSWAGFGVKKFAKDKSTKKIWAVQAAFTVPNVSPPPEAIPKDGLAGKGKWTGAAWVGIDALHYRDEFMAPKHHQASLVRGGISVSSSNPLSTSTTH